MAGPSQTANWLPLQCSSTSGHVNNLYKYGAAFSESLLWRYDDETDSYTTT